VSGVETMTSKLTEHEKLLDEQSRKLFYMVLGELGFVIHDNEDTGEPGLKFEGSKNEMRDGASCLAAVAARLHDILLPVTYSIIKDDEHNDDLSKLAGLQKRFLVRIEYNYNNFMEKVIDDDDEAIFHKHEG
jgi:hypothetical protein